MAFSNTDLPLIDQQRPERGRFTSIRQVRATVDRIHAEQERRVEALWDYKVLSDRAYAAGMPENDLRSRLERNMEAGDAEIERLESFLKSESAAIAEAQEEERASKVIFMDTAAAEMAYP